MFGKLTALPSSITRGYNIILPFLETSLGLLLSSHLLFSLLIDSVRLRVPKRSCSQTFRILILLLFHYHSIILFCWYLSIYLFIAFLSGRILTTMASRGGGGSDFYAVLGLNKECSEADLRNAYKKLAMRWHPDRCSASGNSKFVEEAKEKFQAIQEAYSVLSDSNKRFLYDVGAYDSDDDENDMGDFLGEMAQMMSQTKPNENGQESFEELQQLFVEMFQSDLDGGGFGGPTSSYKTNGYDGFSVSSPSSSSASSQPSCNGNNKRDNSAMSSVKAGTGNFDSGSGVFCFGETKHRIIPSARARPRTQAAKDIKYHHLMVFSRSNLRSTYIVAPENHQMSRDSGQSSNGSGSNSNSKRRNGRKQKVSSKHDVSSRDAEISAA